MIYEVIWDPHALHSLDRLDKTISSRIIKKVEQLRENPFEGDVKKLKGRDHEYRLRVGDYRVIFEITEQTINILKVGHRQNIYDYPVS